MTTPKNENCNTADATQSGEEQLAETDETVTPIDQLDLSDEIIDALKAHEVNTVEDWIDRRQTPNCTETYGLSPANLRIAVETIHEWRTLPEHTPGGRKNDGKAWQLWRAAPITELDLSPDVYQALQQAELVTVGAISDFTLRAGRSSDLADIGPKEVEEIERALGDYYAKWNATTLGS